MKTPSYLSLVLAGTLALTAATYARAAEAEKADKAEKKDDGPSAVDLPPFFAPMNIGGKLTNYAYITVSLMPTSPTAVVDIRAKVAFLQDAFVREVNRGTIAKGGDANVVDTDALKPRLIERMNGVLPAGTVADLKFKEVSITSLNGKQP